MKEEPEQNLMTWQKDFIEVIRREKFSIGSSNKQPLAPELHKALICLSTELYQNSMHFMKELIQNAEDNTYNKQVRPSLEFLLTNEDVADMGVSATLLILNNERGLRTSDVEALCSVKNSTKTGKRDKGFIGCKGIGFKSVFMVSKTPIIISNAFRISFEDDPAEEADVGYIVPKWKETPTDVAILAACGRDKLPNTVIILPLRHDKVALVRRQLKDLSPENILFLSKIRELHVVNKMEDEADHRGFLRIIRSDPLFETTGEIPPRMVSNVVVQGTYKFFKVTLRVECDQADVNSDTFPYLVFQGLFPVTHPHVERQEVHEWAISVAFPIEGRASIHAGDVFSFLPTELRTGFPFIVNADFILTSSRESIRFDTPWNTGILNCIPVAFEVAFAKMIQSPSKSISCSNFLSDKRDAYKFLPINTVENAYRYSSAGSVRNRTVRQKIEVQPQQASNIHQLEKVRDEIFHRVGKCKYIFLSSPGIDKGLQLSKDYDLPAESCLFIQSSFREILKSAALCTHPAPSAVLECAKKLADGRMSSGSKFGIVDEYVQQKYPSGLSSLGVSEMTVSQYESFLQDSNWVINLPDDLYIQVLGFFAFEVKHLNQTNLRQLDLFKIRVFTGKRRSFEDVGKSTKVTSFGDLKDSELLYTSSMENADWIFAWTEEFSAWDPVKVLPAATSQALIESSNSKDLIRWMSKHVSITELGVCNYAQRLIAKLSSAEERVKKDSKFSVLVLQFLYSGIHDKKWTKQFVVDSIHGLRHVFVFDAKSSRERSVTVKMRKEGWILLPSAVSKWPNLFTCKSNSKHLITLSDRYLDPQCSLVEKIVTQSPGPGSMLQFIKETFSAVDLPQIKLPVGESVAFRSVTMERSLAMLNWLKVFLPNRKLTRLEHRNDGFLKSVKEFKWVKTLKHEWQIPSSVFFSARCFEGRFEAHDLPFLDVPAYGLSHLTGYAAEAVFEELGLVTDMKKHEACVAILEYFASRSANELDLKGVCRFYTYFHDLTPSVAPRDQLRSLKIWIPADATSKQPVWKDPTECIISDELGIFADSSSVKALDEIYGINSVPLKFFSAKLQVPENGSGTIYCKIWVEWSRMSPSLDNVTDKDGCPQKAALVSSVNVQHVLTDILENWRDPSSSTASKKGTISKDSGHDFGKDQGKDCVITNTSEGCRKDSSSEDLSADSGEDLDSVDAIKDFSTAADSKHDSSINEEVWRSFHSRAWVPVTPVIIKELPTESNDTMISIVPPSQVLIDDVVELSDFFSAVANGKLNFVWLLPSLSSQESAKLVKMYSKMGVRKLSELVKCQIIIPPRVWKTKVPQGAGLICEGLFRIVLAYLCKIGKRRGLSAEARQNILSPLISAAEVVISGPFEKILSLQMETWASPETVKCEVFAHYDKVKRKLYCIERNHEFKETNNICRRTLCIELVTTIANGILSEHPHLVEGLIALLSPLFESRFSKESVEFECQAQKLSIPSKDEELLMESMEMKTRDSATR